MWSHQGTVRRPEYRGSVKIQSWGVTWTTEIISKCYFLFKVVYTILLLLPLVFRLIKLTNSNRRYLQKPFEAWGWNIGHSNLISCLPSTARKARMGCCYKQAYMYVEVLSTIKTRIFAVNVSSWFTNKCTITLSSLILNYKYVNYLW